MQQSAILTPFIGMMLLTLAVWIYLYVRRLHFIAVNKIDAQDFNTRSKSMSVGPESVQNPSNNLQNLFELPVLFYAICLYLYLVLQVDAWHLWCAYGFLALRTLHSIIHCTFNLVILRFAVYALSALALWCMIARAALALM